MAFRSHEFHDICAEPECDASGATECARCARPLCEKHVPADQMRCRRCEQEWTAIETGLVNANPTEEGRGCFPTMLLYVGIGLGFVAPLWRPWGVIPVVVWLIAFVGYWLRPVRDRPPIDPDVARQRERLRNEFLAERNRLS